MRNLYLDLNIADYAPDEVVQAAYRALALRYHPDKNPGDADAARILKIANEAYEILSDPLQRGGYDYILADIKNAQAKTGSSFPPPPFHSQQASPPGWPPPPPSKAPRQSTFWRTLWGILLFSPRLTLCAGVFGWFAIASIFEKKSVPKPYTQNPPRSAYEAPTSAFVRPETAPNGQPWPTTASYIDGYEILARNGHSTVTIDNSRNHSDVFLKLVALDAATDYPVRICFVPASSQFVFQGVAPGRYDVRYRDLSSGSLSKTEAFTLSQTQTNQGTEYSTLSLTLYKVVNGNMHTAAIDESQF